jgi:hypothetical protein
MMLRKLVVMNCYLKYTLPCVYRRLTVNAVLKTLGVRNKLYSGGSSKLIIIGQKVKVGNTCHGSCEDRWMTENVGSGFLCYGDMWRERCIFWMLQPCKFKCICVKLTSTTRIAHAAENLPCQQLQLQYWSCRRRGHFRYWNPSLEPEYGD